MLRCLRLGVQEELRCVVSFSLSSAWPSVLDVGFSRRFRALIRLDVSLIRASTKLAESDRSGRGGVYGVALHLQRFSCANRILEFSSFFPGGQSCLWQVQSRHYDHHRSRGACDYWKVPARRSCCSDIRTGQRRVVTGSCYLVLSWSCPWTQSSESSTPVHDVCKPANCAGRRAWEHLLDGHVV